MTNGSKRKLILVVEDEDQYAKLLKKKLDIEGFEVELAVNGSQAFDLLKENTPDLVVLDLVMPKMDGRSLLEKMEVDDRLNKIKIIVLSNLGEETGENLNYKCNICGYVVKTNISLEKMVEKIKNLCS